MYSQFFVVRINEQSARKPFQPRLVHSSTPPTADISLAWLHDETPKQDCNISTLPFQEGKKHLDEALQSLQSCCQIFRYRLWLKTYIKADPGS